MSPVAEAVARAASGIDVVAVAGAAAVSDFEEVALSGGCEE
jgi:hypothetical protein